MSDDEYDHKVSLEEDMEGADGMGDIDMGELDGKEHEDIVERVDMDDDDDGQSYPALTAKQMGSGIRGYRKVPVPPHRYTPLKDSWMEVSMCN